MASVGPVEVRALNAQGLQKKMNSRESAQGDLPSKASGGHISSGKWCGMLGSMGRQTFGRERRAFTGGLERRRKMVKVGGEDSLESLPDITGNNSEMEILQ